MENNNSSKKGEYISLKVLAKELELSISTVSRALNDHWEISAKVKAKVLEHAKKRGYRPNIAAKTLHRGKSDFIGIIVPNIATNFFATTIDAMVDVIEKRGYRPIILTSRESVDDEIECINNVLDLRVSGVIMCLTQLTQDYQHLEMLNEANIPVVFFDRIPVGMDIYAVTANDYEASYKLTKQLIDRRLRNIWFISGYSYMSITQQRSHGFIDAMGEAGIKIKPHNIIESRLDKPIEKDIASALRSRTSPDAIICMSNNIMEIVIKLIDENISICPNIVIAGFSNNKMINIVSPNSPIIIHNTKQIGISTATKLIDIIQNSRRVSKIDVIESEII